MTTDTNYRLPYPPVAVAVALAERSHTLPGSPPAARARLAFVVALGRSREWSAATRAAHALREVRWDALARHLGEPPESVERLDPAVLLALLGRRPGRAA